MESLAAIAPNLSSLDHALLLSLIAKQHCLIESTRENIDDVAQEIRLIADQLFGLRWASVDCQQDITPEDLVHGILITDGDEEEGEEIHAPLARLQFPENNRAASRAGLNIANIIILKNLNAAPKQVQIQVLELIRSKRVNTHRGDYSTPEAFLLVLLAIDNAEPLNPHLNDMIFLSHHHIPTDELPRLDSSASQDHPNRSTLDTQQYSSPIFSSETLQTLSTHLSSINLTSETRSYLQTLIISIRTHRIIIPGSATPFASQDLELLSRCLALLHGINYISPSVVALAARKVYRHRLRMLKPADASWERSVMYGSRVGDVKDLLERIWRGDDGKVRTRGEVAESLIEGVITGVEVPI